MLLGPWIDPLILHCKMRWGLNSETAKEEDPGLSVTQQELEKEGLPTDYTMSTNSKYAAAYKAIQHHAGSQEFSEQHTGSSDVEKAIQHPAGAEETSEQHTGSPDVE